MPRKVALTTAGHAGRLKWAARSQLTGRGRSPRRGQAVVEFALVVPILLALLVGLADWARLFTTAISVEAAAREAAMHGGFDASYWQLAPVNNVPGTIAAMQERVCTGTGSLVDYVGLADHSTCTNPQWLTSTIGTQSDAVAAGILIRPAGVTDCSNPGPSQPVCQVRVRLQYQFRMLLGGIGIPGVLQLPATFDISREVTMPVNDFPQAAP
jgi:hypothetical protein